MFKEAVEQIVKKNLKAAVTSGIVVNVSENYCDVKREGLPTLTKVRYQSGIDSTEDFIKVVPAAGSYVLCAIIENDQSEAFIIGYGKIDKVNIKIGNAEFLLENGKFTVKNENADLKQILTKGFETLINSKITTPAGPGEFSVPDQNKFLEQKNKVEQLFI